MPLAEGEVLNNRYRIIKPLGKGGFGEVYQAWDQRLEGYCAVKCNLQPSAEVHRQFEKEARLLFKLQHAGLPMVYDYFEELGEQYLVMQFIEGENLQSMINRQGAIPVQQALDWIEQVCAALIYLHSRQPPVIHRDIKPANIIITPEGRAVLVDFGIAKTGDVQQMTSTGARGVTPGFSPPEQYGPSGTDAQSDVYALAATLYALLTGKVPEDSYLVTLKERPPVPPAYTVNPKIPRKISTAIQAAMQLSRSERTRSVSQFVAALKGQAVGEGVAAPPPVTPTIRQTPPPEGTQRYPEEVTPSKTAWTRVVGFVLLGIFTLAVIAGAIWWISQASNRDVKEIAPIYQTQTAVAAWLEQTVQAGRRAMALQETASAETLEAFNALLEATRVGVEAQATVDALATEMEMANEHRRMTEAALEEQATQIALQQQATLEAQAREETQKAAARDTPAANARQIVDDKGIVMVLVEAGPFEMGMSADDAYKECQKLDIGGTCERNWLTDMEPVHTVYLDAYYIDKFEVTNASYEQCVADGACTLPQRVSSDTRDPYYGEAQYDNYPVVNVNWEQANAYCQWRGNGTRLPTEAEWEKAARGTDGRWYPWGSIFNGNIANFCDTNCTGDWKNTSFDDGYADTAPVDAYPEGISPYGVFNMAGNVWEWVNDWYANDYYNSQDEWNNPQGPGTGEARVLRGGAWDYLGYGLLSAYRLWNDPSVWYYYIGFRCLRSP